MTLDKWIALCFMLVCLLYGYTAFNYELLPFERNLAFLPNTLPKALSVFGVLLCVLILLAPKPPPDKVDASDIDIANLQQYKVGQALALLGAMLAYALLLRALGFVVATTLFLIAGGCILGERKWHFMLPIALGGALFVWYLVHELLGIFLKPWPWFIA